LTLNPHKIQVLNILNIYTWRLILDTGSKFHMVSISDSFGTATHEFTCCLPNDHQFGI